MSSFLQSVNRRSGWIAAAGLVAVAACNWRQWHADRALLRKRGQTADMPVQSGPIPRVSVLAAAWNESGTVKEHVASFLGLRYPNKELILCAGGDDGSYEIASCFAKADVVVLEQRPDEGKQAALRRCLEKATGEIIYLTDADGLLDDTSFEATLHPLLGQGEEASTGTCRPLPRQEKHPFVAYQWSVMHYSSLLVEEYSPGLLGCNSAVKYDALVRSGGFDAVVSVGTDYHLARQLQRAGFRIRMARESVVPTKFPETAGGYIRRQSRWLRNLFFHGLATEDHDQVCHTAVTWSIAIASLWTSIVGLAGVPLARIVWAWLFGYSLATRLRYVLLARQAGYPVPVLTLALLPCFVYLDWLAWARGAVDALIANRRWRW